MKFDNIIEKTLLTCFAIIACSVTITIVYLFILFITGRLAGSSLC